MEHKYKISFYDLVSQPDVRRDRTFYVRVHDIEKQPSPKLLDSFSLWAGGVAVGNPPIFLVFANESIEHNESTFRSIKSLNLEELNGQSISETEFTFCSIVDYAVTYEVALKIAHSKSCSILEKIKQRYPNHEIEVRVNYKS